VKKYGPSTISGLTGYDTDAYIVTISKELRINSLGKDWNTYIVVSLINIIRCFLNNRYTNDVL